MMACDRVPLFRFDDVRGGDGENLVIQMVQGSWAVPHDLPWLDGHFPGSPVVPAAIILEASLELLRLALGEPLLQAAGASGCKFKSPVVPGRTYRIQAARRDPASWEVTWTPASRTGDERGSVVELELGVHRPDARDAPHIEVAGSPAAVAKSDCS